MPTLNNSRLLNGANRFQLGRSGWWIIGRGVSDMVVACSEAHLNIAITERAVACDVDDELAYA